MGRNLARQDPIKGLCGLFRFKFDAAKGLLVQVPGQNMIQVANKRLSAVESYRCNLDNESRWN